MRWITCSSRWNTSNQIFDLSIFYALCKRWTTCSLALTKMETNSWLSKRFLCSLRITVFSNHTTANSPPLFNNQLCVCIRTCVCSCILICIFFFKFHTSISRFSTTTTCLWDPRQPIMGITCITFTSSFFSYQHHQYQPCGQLSSIRDISELCPGLTPSTLSGLRTSSDHQESSLANNASQTKSKRFFPKLWMLWPFAP